MPTVERGASPSDADTVVVAARLPPALAKALERFIAADTTGMTRPEALERAFRDWALQNGFLHPDDESAEGMRPEDLNAANDG